MNRPLALVLGLLFLWGSAVYGCPTVCCCKMDTSTFMDHSSDSCGSHTEAWLSQRHLCSHNGLNGCSSFCRAKEPVIAGLAGFQPLFSDHQICAFPLTLLDSEKPLQTWWRTFNRIRCSQTKPIELLLQTSSFLS